MQNWMHARISTILIKDLCVSLNEWVFDADVYARRGGSQRSPRRVVRVVRNHAYFIACHSSALKGYIQKKISFGSGLD